MEQKTSRESFILKPSTIPGAGVGVFALHDITEGAYMELFLPDFQEELRNKEDVPEELRAYCLGQVGGKILCPKFFNRLDIGNYINHSNNANMTYKKGAGYFAKRDILKGEELLANYRELEEPEETREEYYK